jgi:hypothetical protein
VFIRKTAELAHKLEVPQDQIILFCIGKGGTLVPCLSLKQPTWPSSLSFLFFCHLLHLWIWGCDLFYLFSFIQQAFFFKAVDLPFSHSKTRILLKYATGSEIRSQQTPGRGWVKGKPLQTVPRVFFKL